MKEYVLFFLILAILIVNSGCIQPGPSQGSTPFNPTSPPNLTQTSAVSAGLSTNSSGIIRPPQTETTFSNDNHNSGVSPLITPNETNTIKGNITPFPQPKIYLFSLEEAPQLSNRPLFVPTYLPPGFTYLGGALASNGVVWLQISNTTTTIMFIQAPQWSDVGYLIGPEYHNLNVNDHTYGCSETETLHQLTWTDGSHDYYLISELNCSELLPIATSLVPLDYEVLDQLPYKVSNPRNPMPDPERIRIIFPQAWIQAHYPDKYHSRTIAINMSSEEFNSSFSPDPRDPSMLRHKEVQEKEPVVYLSLPKEMFDALNVEPGRITISYPTDFFRYYTNMESLYEDHWKDPYPPDWKPRNPEAMGIITVPITPANPK